MLALTSLVIKEVVVSEESTEVFEVVVTDEAVIVGTDVLLFGQLPNRLTPQLRFTLFL